MIEVKEVFYSFRKGTPQEIKALSGVSFSIYPGEFVSIIGPNGSGKSTLAKHLNALLIPQEGDVYVCGLNTKKAEPYLIKRIVGMVLQNPENQAVASVVEEDVAFGPENLGLPSSEIVKRIEEALRSVGLWEYRQYPSHLLSGGQKQKLAIASILAMEPEYLILDEATNLLDHVGRSEVIEVINFLNSKKKVAVIQITSSMEEVLLSKKVAVMNNGRIILTGSPEKVFVNSEILRKTNLEAPDVVKLSQEFIQLGILDRVCFAEEDLVSSLCSLRLKN